MRPLIILLLVILGTVLAWHIFFPLLGGVIAVTSIVWGGMVAAVVGLCAAIILVFVLTGTGIFLLTVGAFVWTLLAIIFFPVVFPIVAPIFVIYLVVSYFWRRRATREAAEFKNKLNAD